MVEKFTKRFNSIKKNQKGKMRKKSNKMIIYCFFVFYLIIFCLNDKFFQKKELLNY